MQIRVGAKTRVDLGTLRSQILICPNDNFFLECAREVVCALLEIRVRSQNAQKIQKVGLGW